MIECNKKGVKDIRSKYSLYNLIRRMIFNTNEPKTQYNAEAISIEKYIECLKQKEIFVKILLKTS